MKQICISCDGGLNNTGRTGKAEPFGFPRGSLRFATVADDGTLNSLDLTAPDLNAELLGKINHVDPSKRFYINEDFVNVDNVTAEPTYSTNDLQVRTKLMDGLKTMTYEQEKVTHEYFRQLSALCGDNSEILFDECGNLLGITNEDETEMFGREINGGSYSAILVSAKAGTNKQMMRVNYDYDVDTHDSQLTMLDANSFDSVNVLNLRSMLDVVLNITVDTATELTVKAHLIYGSVGKKIPVSGLELADFDLLDNTGTSVGAIVSVVETAVKGTYTVTTPATTTGDEYTLTVFKAATIEKVNGLESFPTNYTSL